MSVHLDADPEAVWAYVEQVERHAEWMHDAAEIHFVSDAIRATGVQMDVDTRLGPLRTTDRMTITTWAPPREMGVRHSGAVTGEGRFRLTAEGGGTRFTWAEDLRLPWWFGGPLGELAARPALEHVWRRNLAGLKERLEAGPDRGQRAASPGTAREAAILCRVVARGFPAPAVLAGDELLIEEVQGPTMLDDLRRRPWRVLRHARTLARLHRSLHRIDAPAPSAAASGEPACVVHLHLGPRQVVLAARGPVVVDWRRAGAGPAELDEATTVLLVAAERARAGRFSPAGAVLAVLGLRFVAHVARDGCSDRVQS